MGILKKTRVVGGLSLPEVDISAVIADGRPRIVKGVLAEHPLVKAATHGHNQAMDYLSGHSSARPALCYTIDPSAKGRLFYNEQMNGFNFSVHQIPINAFFELLKKEYQEQTGTGLYIGSAELDEHFPDFLVNTGLELPGEVFKSFPPRVGIWLGNKSVASAHYDVSNNVAICLAGKRRFTLLPPGNPGAFGLGPIAPTPGGQTISLFDVRTPNLEAFPEAASITGTAEVAEIEAGDMLIYPSMWWHQVEALADFNVMVNYWWNELPSYIDDPMTTVLHGILSLRERPASEKAAWRELFDYYVFGDPEVPRGHLPEHAWGDLAPLDEASARRLRAQILRRINR